MTATTRRAALGALAAASALALPAVAIAASPTGDDAELISLAAEIQRLRAQVKEISAKGIEPFNETFFRLVQDTPGPWRVGVRGSMRLQPQGRARSGDRGTAES
jgi:predicted aminopeptidase